MKVSLMYTARCNASCGHCSTSCGPQRTETLSRDTIFRVMEEAAQLSLGEPLKFGITGGEPFLDFELLHDVVAHGKHLGAEMGCVTNAYWATSAEKARTLLGALQDAGLMVLSISTSRFHREFVNVRRVERALNAARELDLQCGVKVAILRPESGDEAAIRAWAKDAGAWDVQIFPVVPSMRDSTVLSEDEYLRVPGLPEGRCPGMGTTVAWDGEAYTCCTPGALTRFFSLGNVHELGLSRIADRSYIGGRQQILREHGPIHFAREIQARGLGGRLRPAYSCICELCTHIGTDPDLARVAAEMADAREVQQLREILGLRTEPAVRPSGRNF